MYELEMFVWFLSYYVIDLDFEFVDFQVFIMVTVELGVYIITIYYATYLSNFFYFFLSYYNIWLMLLVELFDTVLFPMFVWFVLYYVTDLDFGFVDFQVFIMVIVELGVYIITIYYAMYLFYLFIFLSYYNLQLMLLVELFDKVLFPMLMVS